MSNNTSIKVGVQRTLAVAGAAAGMALAAACHKSGTPEPDAPPVIVNPTLHDTVVVINSAADLQKNVDIIAQYTKAGKKVEVTINFPMGISAKDLNDPKSWIANSKVSLKFGTNGAVYASTPDINLSAAIHEKLLKECKIIPNPTTGAKFVIAVVDANYWANLAKAGKISMANLQLSGFNGPVTIINNPQTAAAEISGAVKTTKDTTILMTCVVPITNTDGLNNPKVKFAATENGGFIADGSVPVKIDAQTLTKIINVLHPDNKAVAGNHFQLANDADADKIPDAGIVFIISRGNASRLLEDVKRSKKTKSVEAPNLPIPVIVNLDQNLIDFNALTVALADFAYQIKLIPFENLSARGGKNALGNVTDLVMSNITRSTDAQSASSKAGRSPVTRSTGSAELFTSDEVILLGAPRTGNDYTYGTEGEIQVTKLEVGGNKSWEKLVDSHVAQSQGGGLSIPNFTEAAVEVVLPNIEKCRADGSYTSIGSYPITIEKPMVVSSEVLKYLRMAYGQNGFYAGDKRQGGYNSATVYDVNNMILQVSDADSLKMRNVLWHLCGKTPEQLGDDHFYIDMAYRLYFKDDFNIEFKNLLLGPNNEGKWNKKLDSFLRLDPRAKVPSSSGAVMGIADIDAATVSARAAAQSIEIASKKAKTK